MGFLEYSRNFVIILLVGANLYYVHGAKLYDVPDNDPVIINSSTEPVPEATTITDETTTITPNTTLTPTTPSTSAPTTKTTTKPETTTANATTPATTIPTSTTTTTVKPTPPEPTPKPTPTPLTTTSKPAPTPSPHKDRHFDGPSFIGGIILASGLMAIGFVAFKFYRARTERNYHTL